MFCTCYTVPSDLSRLTIILIRNEELVALLASNTGFLDWIMHQYFVSPDPFTFLIFKSLLKALHCCATFVVKFLPNAPFPRC